MALVIPDGIRPRIGSHDIAPALAGIEHHPGHDVNRVFGGFRQVLHTADGVPVQSEPTKVSYRCRCRGNTRHGTRRREHGTRHGNVMGSQVNEFHFDSHFK